MDEDSNMKKNKILSLVYKIIVVLMIIFLVFILTYTDEVFLIILGLYILFSLSFIWFKTILWAVVDVSKKSQHGSWNKPFTIVVPIKNEDPKRFWWVLDNIVKSNGKKQVLVGDDGSSKENLSDYIKICREHKKSGNDISLFSFKSIKKRNVQCFLHKLAKYDIVINVDSDVIVQKDTFVKLLVSFNDEKVGIANARLRIFEGKRLIDGFYKALYEGANQVGRRIFGAFGQMPCASGEILAYRKEVLDKNFDKYKNAFYLWGVPITYGEDRLLTNIILKEGYKSVYCEDSIGWTWAKSKLSDFLKQQTRWRRSWVRESLRCISFCYKKPLLFLNTLFGLVLPILFSIIILTLMARGIITHSPYILYTLFGISGIIIITTYIRDLPLLIEDPSLAKILYLYALLNLFLITPIWLYAIFSIDSTEWGTR